MSDILNFIDGAYVAGGGRWFDVVNPATGQPHARASEAAEADVDRAVAAARRAMAGPWGRTSEADRTAMLNAIADEIDRRAEDFLAAEIADTGKPLSLAGTVDIPRGAANFRIFAKMIGAEAERLYEMATPDGAGALNYAIRRPKGVVAVISPWNLPLLLMTWKVAPALACGNAVVCKPSEETPSTCALLGEVMRAVGLPDGVFNVVHGFGPGSAGAFLTAHPDVDAITFTGETRTGEAIMKAAAVGTRDISSELGGKNAGVIFADCDLEAAIEGTARSTFTNCGQVCLCTERLYVERPIFDAFVAGLKAKAEALVPGAPFDSATTIGPLISAEHRTKVMGYFETAAADGATVVTGGSAFALPGDHEGGFFVRPTLWTGLAEDSAAVREEVFGPVAHIAPFDSEAEAIALANDTRYGLAATLWTRDLSRAHRVGAALEAGIIWVNTWNLRDLRTAFGGAKQSGIGREGGAYSFDFYSETRNICIKL
ncbi:2-hydroxymuconic semialdehyde dehydrogenase [Acuticoccus sp. MNP-M23]|uniref:2-hydroxymuconic semialdehyde dehydrogenase n=1 Tax=Acuticoccus sp. MNP-M23 TaxID=3072793 RepID=UPI002815A3A6|nr:2-hydroxymuconic semialdehyde dehydrogenase [Acuticoccus sp. MNP-M23]WMS43827.1 2-hydroxymuconic semialdehyde dehydrogenase [Acuticoccus sp. MNP-M23]